MFYSLFRARDYQPTTDLTATYPQTDVTRSQSFGSQANDSHCCDLLPYPLKQVIAMFMRITREEPVQTRVESFFF